MSRSNLPSLRQNERIVCHRDVTENWLNRLNGRNRPLRHHRVRRGPLGFVQGRNLKIGETRELEVLFQHF